MTDKETTETEAYEWHGRTIVDSDGEKIGKVSEIYLDDRTEKPEWATVSSGLFGGQSHFVPLVGATSDGENIRARVTMEQVKDAPGIDRDAHLSEQEEAQLFEHYGIPYTNDDSTTAQGHSDAGQLAGGARLRKYTAEDQTTVVGSVRGRKSTSAD
jgi:sporulation protein YlmC with PRC-barrel domain